MNVNKKLGRFKQWAGEKMGGEVKTGTSEEFKMLEMEMNLRQEGIEKMQRSMNVYVKSISKRAEGDDRDKALPGGVMGSTMVQHSQDFEPDSEFGNCLSALGRANERLAREQEAYVAGATTSWLEGLERSVAQMKEYQAARKKLEQRRLAYDTSLAKMAKTKKEDFRVEEELRAQKMKYEESNEDVFRRMQDIKESEVDLIADLTSFLEAELSYHDHCREILLNVKRDWPGRDVRRPGRSRSNTAHGYNERFNPPPEEEPMPEQPRITIPRLNSRNISPSPSHDSYSPGGYSSSSRPSNRNLDGPSTTSRREMSPAPRLNRSVTTESSISNSRANLRPVRAATHNFKDNDYDNEYSDNHYFSNSQRRDRTPSPSNSQGSALSRTASWTVGEQREQMQQQQQQPASTGKKAPPPPPPSRAKKPPPPPPPMKRSALSASESSNY